ncbi:taste receptor type 1 member 3 [Pipra filicauda]|uniref:Taste receptor type 1 member 3 n=1 Tax=Pipra filicauda TaxID=649802 RepID=A0A6J2HA90_9PASS|nr:taste receptor type 1 member 3 [Pipra filicauda]
MVPELLLCLGLGCAGALSPTCLSAQFRRPGDYILGGLFPFGKDTLNLSMRVEPTPVVCERLNTDGLIWALGMKFAVDEINNSTSLLPGVTLGYDIYDSCFEPLVALQASLMFLTRNDTTGIGILCDSTDCQPRVTAVIGPHKSDLSLVTAKLFSTFFIPQVSYAASSEKLSNSELFPSFYRTLPGDKNVVEAVVQLLNRFGWNWIATVASDDEYGQGAQELFLSTAANNNICIAFEGIIPTDVTEPSDKKQLEDVINLINRTKVNIVVLFAYTLSAQALMEQAIKMGLSKKVWIGSQAWMLSDLPASIPNIQSIGTVLGFVTKTGTVPGFQKYVADLFTSVQQDEFCQQSRELNRLMSTNVLDLQCQECDNISLGDLSFLLSITQVQPVHMAVYSVAYALHRALGCTYKACPKTPIRSWQLLYYMDALPFEVNGQSYRFDQSHSTNTGYKLILWSWKNGILTYLPVGDYKESLHIEEPQIQFHTPDQKAPTSECFRHCKPGQIRRVKGSNLCCYDCTDCAENTFWNSQDSSSCTPCLQQQWAPPQSTQCYERSERFLFWDEPLTIALLVLMSITILLTCLTALLLLRNLQTPLVQAAGAERSLFALLCLGLLSLSCCLYVGKPSDTHCAMQEVVHALCLNGCFSTFFIKTLEITLVTEFPSYAPSLLRWVTHRRSWLLVALCLLVQGLLCLCHLYLGPAYLAPDYKSQPTEVLLVCSTKSWAAFALLHSLNGCLALLCFLGTFMVQTLGKKYNLARGITFAILIYFVIWIFFVAIFATLGTVLRPISQIATILIISLGILVTNYAPKCYIILFKPEMNTVDCFQNFIQEEPEEDSANKQ